MTVRNYAMTRMSRVYGRPQPAGCRDSTGLALFGDHTSHHRALADQLASYRDGPGRNARDVRAEATGRADNHDLPSDMDKGQ